MKKPLIIVKIGGSVITYKNRSVPAIRKNLVRAIGHILAKHYNPHQHSLILVHGAGSYGHLSAKKYGLREGTKDHPEKFPRALENQTFDQELNTEMCHLFLSVGLLVAGINTSSVVVNKKGKLALFSTTSIETALTHGVIPLLHGDMVFDTAWGMSISSGDVLVPSLAKKFGAERIYYASDVDGIFTSDPYRDKNATLIPTLSVNELFGRQVQLSHSHNTDVTAGFAGKFKIYSEQRFASLQSIHVFNGLVKENFKTIFLSHSKIGTVVFLDKKRGPARKRAPREGSR